MEIQKIFSSYDDYGYEEDRIYSVLMSEEELEAMAMFSEEPKRKALKDVDSTKGIKRTYLSALMTGGGSIAGRMKGEKEADLADEEGASDVEILRRAGRAGGKRGAAVGAAGGALLGAAVGLRGGVRRAAASAARQAVGGAALGYFGGRNSTRVQTKDRLRKRSGGV